MASQQINDSVIDTCVDGIQPSEISNYQTISESDSDVGISGITQTTESNDNDWKTDSTLIIDDDATQEVS